ncbi:MAG: hypothetical protein JW747_04625 [Candidatus Aminicenantes bacterium]|nr:hypothetical protein [Candidatus Aminicenantes bacterium]
MKRKGFRIIAVAGLLIAFCASLRAGSDGAVPQPGILESTFKRMQSRLESVEDYQCLYTSFAVKGTRRADTVLRYFYKTPGLIRAEIVDGENRGTVLLVREGQVRVKPPGIFSLLVFHYPSYHPRVTDIRGNRLDETTWEYFVEEHVRNLGLMTLRSQRRETLDGRRALVLETVSEDPLRTRGIAREVLWIRAEDDILLRFEMYDASGRLIQMSRFTDIVINSGLPDSLFTRFRKR